MAPKSPLMDLDNAELKALLQSFREGTPDRDDPVFKEAFAKVAGDPDLAAWWRAEQAFDAVVVEIFRTVLVPLDVKANILRDAQTARNA